MYSYRTVISFPFPTLIKNNKGEEVYTNEIKYLPLDYQSSKTVNANSQIASQPLMSGDVMADHMYRQPISVNVGGKFGVFGRNALNDSYSFIGGANRLENIEKTFEFIKNNGILCTITTIETDIDKPDADNDTNGVYSNAKSRFITRKNMALNSISWTEHENTLEFNLGFTEVISIDLIEYEVDAADAYLPNINEPNPRSIGTLLLEQCPDELVNAIVNLLHKRKYFSKQWLKVFKETYQVNEGLIDLSAADGKLKGNGKAGGAGDFWAGVGSINAIIASIGAAVAAIIGISVGIAGGAIGATALAALGAVFPVGTVIAVIAAAAIGIAAAIVAIRKRADRRKKRDYLIGANGDGVETGLRRIQYLVNNVASKVNEHISGLSIYGFEKDEDQEVILSIGGAYFYFKIIKIAVEPYFKIVVKSTDTSFHKGEEYSLDWKYCTGVNDADIDNRLFLYDSKAGGMHDIYLMNVALSETALEAGLNQSEEEQNNVRKNLTSYSIWVTNESLNKLNKKIEDAVEAGLDELGYTK